MDGKKILIIDDESELQEALATALTGAGFAILQATSGAEGLELALSEQPDLILLDIVMPGINGHETLSKIRADAWGAEAKVIFLTAFDDTHNIVQAVEQDSAEYIVKTDLSLQEIITKCKQVISGYDS